MGLTNNLGKLSSIITSTGSAVGIGTSSPQSGYILDVKGFAQFGNSTYSNVIRLGDQDANSTIIQSVTTAGVAKNMTFWNTSERMRISSTGLVGIGTTNPRGAGGSYNSMEIYGASGASLLLTNGGDNVSFFYTAASGGDLLIENSGAQIFRAGSAERMRITSGGNVGIGTSSPSDGNGFGRIIDLNGTGPAAYYARYASSSTLYSLLGQDSGFTYLLTRSTPLLFFVNNTERMRMFTNGNVAIGTTTDTTFKFTAQGEVLSDGDSAALFVQARDLSTRYAWYASNSTYLNFYNTGSGVTGQFTRTSGAYTALSDVNKKKDFEQSTIGLSAILALKPTLFRMKDDEENCNKQLGFIAQEVKEFIPQAYVENGDFIGLQDRPIIAALVRAIQELEARIKTLENK